MSEFALRRIFLCTLAFFLVSCASTGPKTIRTSLIKPEITVNDEGVFTPKFSTVTIAAIQDTTDGIRAAALEQITFNTNPKHQISGVATSPKQDAMVYASYRGQKSSIYRQSLGSQAQSPLISEMGLDMSPAFTPDGRYLVFSSDRSGETQSLWRKRSDGAGGTTQITSSNSFDWHPSIAADGETIIFQSHRRNNVKPSIWSINMNGGLLTQLAVGHSPQVSPDGRKIVFVRNDKNGTGQLWSMQIDASGLTQLSTGTSSSLDPAWHPTGRYIVYSSDKPAAGVKKGNYNIWIMRSDGTKNIQLTENISHDDTPVFERRGKKIIFRSNRGGHWNLFSFSPKIK